MQNFETKNRLKLRLCNNFSCYIYFISNLCLDLYRDWRMIFLGEVYEELKINWWWCSF